MLSSKRIEFRTIDGVTLRGDFYQAEGDHRPCVVMTAGLALLKEFVEPQAKFFQKNGVSALLFDYRNYGSSDGTPRHETNILQQADDYRDAVTAAMDLDGVDPAKIVYWGVGHGGGATIIAAADDPRPKAVVLQSPMVSGEVDSKGFPEGWAERAWIDRERRTRSGAFAPAYIQAWPESIEQARGQREPVLFQFEAAFNLITAVLPRSLKAGTPWENRITTRSLQNVASVEPKDWLHRIRQPTLYIVPPTNAFTGSAEYQKEAFGRMGPNGRFEVFTPPTDVSPEEFVAAIITPQLEFIRKVVE